MAEYDFMTDQQTVDDLSIFGKDKLWTVYDLFNKPVTLGSQRKLQEMLQKPLNHVERLCQRVAVFRYFSEKPLKALILKKSTCDFIEYYLRQTQNDIVHTSKIRVWLQHTFSNSYKRHLREQGVTDVSKLLVALRSVLDEINVTDCPEQIRQIVQKTEMLLNDENLSKVLSLNSHRKASYKQLILADWVCTVDKRTSIEELLEIYYSFEVYNSVASVAMQKEFCFPEYVREQPTLIVKDCYHPMLSNPVRNSVQFSSKNNIYLLSGANMAGKSTLMRTVGLCIYLSQVGFPVPASSIQSSGFAGLYTTINIGDDMSNNLSHFLAELKRLRHIANQMQVHPEIVLIADELFRGTNGQDAFEASTLFINALAKNNRIVALLSTHISALSSQVQNIANVSEYHMGLAFDAAGAPIFTYRLENGTSHDRIGLWMLEKEQIIYYLEQAATSNRNINDATIN